MMGLLWDIVDAVIDWRIERRRRLPVVAAPDMVQRCAERDPWMNRCVLAAGHAEQHKPSTGPWTQYVGDHYWLRAARTKSGVLWVRKW